MCADVVVTNSVLITPSINTNKTTPLISPMFAPIISLKLVEPRLHSLFTAFLTKPQVDADSHMNA